jgi:translation initiation factor 2B subunit (eIF-2B alpha/beta/delta family)
MTADDRWIDDLPGAVAVPVRAFADPHPPGARARAQLAAQAVLALVEGWSGSDAALATAVDDLVAHLHSVGQTTLHQPGVRNMIDTVLAGGLEGTRDVVVARMSAAYDAASQAMAEATTAMSRAGADLLSDGDRILVHDFADRSTQAVVRRAADDGKYLTVVATACRSRRTDGIRVARESVAVGHDAVVVTDAGVGWAVGSMGLRLCLIGADAILPDGSVLTTPGALTIALVGQRSSVPVYVVTDLWKTMREIPAELLALNMEEDPDGVPEALDWKASGFGYRNPLVDIVPGDALTGIISEAGIIPPATVGRTAKDMYGIGVPNDEVVSE